MKPCPFCGCEQIYIHRVSLRRKADMGYEVYAECHDCQSRGPYQWLNVEFFTTEIMEEKAIEMWNERKGETT